MNKTKQKLIPPPAAPGTPAAVCVQRVELHLLRDPPEFALAEAAIAKYQREWQEEQQRSGDVSKRLLSETTLSVRTVNALEGAGMFTVGDLLARRKEELLCIVGFGEGTVLQIYQMLGELGFEVKAESGRSA